MTDAKIANYEVEQALIAHALRNPSEYGALSDIVKSDMFGWECFGWAWDAMGRLTEKGFGIDGVTLGDELDRSAKLAQFQLPELKAFSGRSAISQLRDIDTTDAGEAYAITVQDYAGKRQIDRLLTESHAWAHNGRTSAAIIADLTTSLGSMVLHGGKVKTHTHNMTNAAQSALEASEHASTGENDVPTGIPELDKILAMQKTELITIAARPGEGKSALCGTIAINAAKSGKRVKLFTLEMGVVQVTQRLIAQLCGISAFRIMRGKLKPEEWPEVQAAANELTRLPITICDLPAMSIGQIRNEARRDEIDLGILDYVQLAKADKKNDRRDLDIGEVTGGLKAIAMELDIPWIEAAQLSRATEQRAGKRPELSDLRESGSIENDSDSVVFIYRPDPLIKTTVELIVAKHRNGPVGHADAYFHEETMRFMPDQFAETDRAAARWQEQTR